MAKKKDNAWLLESFNSIKKTFRKRNINIKFSIPDFILKKDFVFDKPFLKDDFTLTVPIIKKKLFTIKKQGVIKKHYHIDRVKLRGKTYYLDNKLVGIVEETFENLGYKKKDDRKAPKVIAKKKYDYGWHIMFELQTGHSFKKVLNLEKESKYFSTATKSYVDMFWKNGYIHMDIMTDDIPENIPFNWDPATATDERGRRYMDYMILPWPIGYTHGGKLYVIDLATQPHALGAGATGFGKSSFIYVLVMAMLLLEKADPGRVKTVVVDMKQTDFYLINKHALVIEDIPNLYKLMNWIEKEHKRRVQIIRQHRVKNIYQAKKKNPKIDAPSIVIPIDEFAELNEEKPLLKMLNHAVRIYRSSGIHLVLGTQRPSVVGGVMDGDTRGQLPCRVSFKCSAETDSRMILGEQHPDAAWLPDDTKGRAFIRSGIDLKMFQSMYIDEELEERLIYQLDNWGCSNEQQAKGTLQIKG